MCSIEMEREQLPAWQLSDDAAEAMLAARRAELLAEAEVRSLWTRSRASSTER
jgi:hypothetical protein